MYWKTSAAPRCSQSFRPSFEPLEGRLAMAASITTFADFDNATGVRVLDGGGSSELHIVDNTTTDIQTLTLKQRNKPDIVVQGSFRTFDIDMGNGNDKVTYNLDGTGFVQDRRQFYIALGGGRNSLQFDMANLELSNIGLEVVGGSSNDFIEITADAIDRSTLHIVGRLGGGADGELDAKNQVIGPSTVHLGNGSFSDSSVVVDFDLGAGSNNFLASLVKAKLGVTAGLAASQVELNITGSEKSRDVDRITLDLDDTRVGPRSTVAVHVDLLAGNDFFTGLFPGSFSIENSNTDMGGGMLLDVDGGKGNDNILISRDGAGASEIELDGLLTLLLSGGEGNDTIKVDFGAFGLLQTIDASAQDRGLRVRMDGGAGNDTLDLYVSNNNTATFLYDLHMKGGSGNDNVTFLAANVGGTPSFGPKIGESGFVVLDGGSGTDLRKIIAIGGFPSLKTAFEGELP